MPGSALTRSQANVQVFQGLLRSGLPKLRSLLESTGTDPKRFCRIALNAYTTTAKLTQLSPQSVFDCCMEAAQLNLTPDGVLGEAYLVPFKDKCTLIPGYRGLMQLARRSGEISSIEARVVHQLDKFEFAFGLEPKLVHVPSTDESGAISHVYCVVRLKDGGKQWDVMTKSDVDKIRNRSRAGKSGPWVTDYEAMALKTVIKRTLKLCPMATVESQKMHAAVNMDDQRDIGLDPDFDFSSVVEQADEPAEREPGQEG